MTDQEACEEAAVHEEVLERISRIVRAAAQAAHEANRAYCAGLGDHSQQSWEDAPSWQILSVVEGVGHILNSPETTPEQGHEGWYALKEADGWVYGRVKDVEAKTHPCMVPYADLPPSQQYKDTIFGAVVRGILVYHGLI